MERLSSLQLYAVKSYDLNSKKENRINDLKYQSWGKLLGERLVEKLHENKDEI